MKAFYAGMIPYDGKFSVIFPDIAGCATWGATPEHAFAMAVEALAGHLEAMADDGDPIPQPSGREAAWNAMQAEYADMDLGPLPEGTVLQLVPAPVLDAKNEQKAISARRYKWQMVDRKAEAMDMNRSAFLMLAAAAYEVPKQHEHRG